MKKYLSVFLFLLFISTTALYLNQRLLSTLRFNKARTADSTYYVATTGSDASPGTLSSPFADHSEMRKHRNSRRHVSYPPGHVPGNRHACQLWHCRIPDHVCPLQQ